jgi:hypothetical protein
MSIQAKVSSRKKFIWALINLHKNINGMIKKNMKLALYTNGTTAVI